MNDLDEVEIVEHLAPRQNRMCYFDFVVGERHDEVARRVRMAGETLGQVPTHRHFHFVDEVAQDVVHELAFRFAQNVVLAQEEVVDGGDQLGARGGGFGPRQANQRFDIHGIRSFRRARGSRRGGRGLGRIFGFHRCAVSALPLGGYLGQVIFPRVRSLRPGWRDGAGWLGHE